MKLKWSLTQSEKRAPFLITEGTEGCFQLVRKEEITFRAARRGEGEEGEEEEKSLERRRAVMKSLRIPSSVVFSSIWRVLHVLSGACSLFSPLFFQNEFDWWVYLPSLSAGHFSEKKNVSVGPPSEPPLDLNTTSGCHVFSPVRHVSPHKPHWDNNSKKGGATADCSGSFWFHVRSLRSSSTSSNCKPTDDDFLICKIHFQPIWLWLKWWLVITLKFPD